MSDFWRLLSQEESARVAGVSEETIQQYVSFGLLEPVDKEGSPFFRESDIRSLFYTRVKVPSADPVEKESFTYSDQGAANHSQARDSEVPRLSDILSEKAPEESGDELPESPGSTGAIPVKRPVKRPGEGTEQDNELAGGTHSQQTSEPLDKTAEQKTTIEQSEQVESLRAQLELLREERDWLRQRIERLETRSEREQMLLLSENETVRRLISSNEASSRRRPFWHRALPWFGIEDEGKS